MSEQLSTTEVARRIGVTPATLRRWLKAGVIPQADGNGEWTPAARAQARIVARLRDRGHSLAAIRSATESGRLAFGYTMNKQGRGVLLNERGQSLVDATYRSLGYRTNACGRWI